MNDLDIQVFSNQKECGKTIYTIDLIFLINCNPSIIFETQKYLQIFSDFDISILISCIYVKLNLAFKLLV